MKNLQEIEKSSCRNKVDKRCKRQRTIEMRALCAVALCLTMLCACGVQPGDSRQETVEQPAVSNIYDLPLFDNLPKDYSNVDPAFWVAESQNGGKVYLLGSIHAADETAYRLPKHIMDAYLESDALAVEFDMISYESDEIAQKADKERTTYPDGDTLRNHIDPLIYAQLEEYISNNADDPQLLSSLENRTPFIWLSVLSDIEDAAAGLSSEFGIDEHFLQLAHAQEKEIIEIESTASQYDAVNRVPDKAYEFLLSSSVFLTEEDTAGEALKATYDAWKSGTIQGSGEIDDDEVAGEDPSGYAAAIAEYDRILVKERNVVMADAAKSFLDDGKKVFLVVGADHLLGSDGVIALLEADGYHISQLGGTEGLQKYKDN